MQKYTIKHFKKDFPNDAACLEWLKNYRWPNGIFCEPCGKVTKHHLIESRKSYSCQECGHHVHPTAGTIFHKSSTPLTSWFHAIFLMASTRCGISAKQVEREVGVTYKTAWRMCKLIRERLCDKGGDPFSSDKGDVEVDETHVLHLCSHEFKGSWRALREAFTVSHEMEKAHINKRIENACRCLKEGDGLLAQMTG